MLFRSGDFPNFDDNMMGKIMERGGKAAVKPGHATDGMFSLDLFGIKLDYSKVLNNHERMDELKLLVGGAVSPIREGLRANRGLPDTNLIKVLNVLDLNDPLSSQGKSFDFNIEGVEPSEVLSYVDANL